ncbi:hypothetical protein E4U22_002564, partial [Claviceps purpurea]
IQLWISDCVESNAHDAITAKLTTDTGRSDSPYDNSSKLFRRNPDRKSRTALGPSSSGISTREARG